MKYKQVIKGILNNYKNGSNLAVDLRENGLLWTRQKGVTWMKVRNNGTFLQQRMGFVVEVNALWYNAICRERETDIQTERQKYTGRNRQRDI